MSFLQKNSQKALNTFTQSHKASAGIRRHPLCVGGVVSLAEGGTWFAKQKPGMVDTDLISSEDHVRIPHGNPHIGIS